MALYKCLFNNFFNTFLKLYFKVHNVCTISFSKWNCKNNDEFSRTTHMPSIGQIKRQPHPHGSTEKHQIARQMTLKCLPIRNLEGSLLSTSANGVSLGAEQQGKYGGVLTCLETIIKFTFLMTQKSHAKALNTRYVCLWMKCDSCFSVMV